MGIPKKIPYIDRDESWMYFNRRILMEAQRPDIPLLERLNYLGIYANNLDEFFRVRVASIRRILSYGGNVPNETRVSASESLNKILDLNVLYNEEFENTWSNIVALLHDENIHIIDETDLSEGQRKEVLSYYMDNLNGVTNPIFIDSPSFIADNHLKESLYFAVEMLQKKDTDKSDDIEQQIGQLSIIEIPVKEFGRFIRLKNSSDGHSYIMFIDDVIRFCLPFIFSGLDFDVYKAYSFKFTKDSEMEIEAETDLSSSVLDKVRLGLQKRKRGNPIRLVYDESMPDYILKKLSKLADLSKEEALIKGQRYQNLRDLMTFPDCERYDLKNTEQLPLMMSELQYSRSVIEQIFEKDMGIHLPYYSFDHFLRVLREAAISRDVVSIHVTLYRVAQNSKVVKALMAAAQNGKRVTAVVELMARFDEASNINWSKKMQNAGVRVVFGHEKLKIHSKLVYISTKKGNIACIGTGNMHEGTARLYTDYMLMTADKRITSDVFNVFEFIEKPFLSFKFKELLVSPNEMRRKITLLINHEIKNAHSGKEAFIKIKINHIVDEKMVRKLYEASNAGVKIELCVRGNCSIVPDKNIFSDNISITGIIDRYLEHSRIYIFGNAGNPKYFIGSADWMPRNLDRRIEVMVPVYDTNIQKELLNIVDSGIKDNSNGYFVNINEGRPKRDFVDSATLFRSQEYLYNKYKSRHKD